MKKQKWISLLLALSFLVGLVPGGIVRLPAYGAMLSEVPEGYTGIYNAGDLKKVASGLDGKYILMNDVDLTGSWTPVGNKSKPFTGVFNGNGLKISGLKITSANAGYVGMFGYAHNARIENLTLEDVEIDVKDDNTEELYAGAFCGSILSEQDGFTLLNCGVSGSVNVVADKNVVAGGVVGQSMTQSIQNNITGDVYLRDLRSDATLNVRTNGTVVVGGVAGVVYTEGLNYIQGSSAYQYFLDRLTNNGSVTVMAGGKASVGGIVGRFDIGAADPVIRNCVNNGEVTLHGRSHTYLGGILGEEAKNECSILYEKNTNNGNLILEVSGKDGTVNSFVGGILGISLCSLEKTQITDSGNNGVIYCVYSKKVNAYVGGIIGISSHYLGNTDLKRVYNARTIFVNVSVATSYVNLGGIAGFLYTCGAPQITLEDVFNGGTVCLRGSNSKNTGGLIGVVSEGHTNLRRCYNAGALILPAGAHTFLAHSGPGDLRYENCYWLEGSSDYAAGTSTKLTGDQMKNRNSFQGYDFTNVWNPPAPGDYPYPTLRTTDNTKLKWTKLEDDLTDRLIKLAACSVLSYGDLFPVSEAELKRENGTMTIRAEGYYPVEIPESLIQTAAAHISLYAVVPKSTNSHVSAVYCNGYDALVETSAVSFFVKEADAQHPDQQTDTKLKIRVFSDLDSAELKTVQLLQNGTVVKESATGEFEFSADDLMRNTALNVRVVDKNDKKYPLIHTNIQVKPMDEFSFSVKDSKFSFAFPESVPIIGGMEFSIDMGRLPVFFIMAEDSIKIGFGASSSFSHPLKKIAGTETDEYKTTVLSSRTTTAEKTKVNSLWDDWKKTIDDLKEHADQLFDKDARSDYLDELREKIYKKDDLTGLALSEATAKLSGNLSGYVELSRNQSGWQAVHGNGTLNVSGSMDWKWVTFLPVASIPLTLGVQIAVELLTQLDLTYDFASQNFGLTGDIMLKKLPQVKVTGDLGIPKAFTIGAYGSLNNEVNLLFSQNLITAKLSGEIGASGRFLLFEGSIPLLKYLDWEYARSPISAGSQKSAPRRAAAPSPEPRQLYDEAAYRLDTRQYLEFRSDWYGGAAAAAPKRMKAPARTASFTETVLQSSVYDDPQPQIVRTADGLTMMTLTVDLAERATGNQTAAAFSVLDPATDAWSAPVPLADDGTADGYPMLATDGGEIYAVWMNAKTLFDETVTPETFAAACEICAARYDRAAGAFTAPVRLTDNDVYDYMPALWVENGVPYVAFAQNAANSPIRQEGGNRIFLASGRADGGYDLRQLDETEGPLFSLSVGCLSGTPVVAYEKDEDLDIGTPEDAELYAAVSGAAPLRLTENEVCEQNVRFVRVNGGCALAYYASHNVRYTADLANWTAVSETGSELLSPSYEFCETDGRSCLIACTADPDRDASNLFECLLLDGVWTAPVRLTDSPLYVRQFAALPEEDAMRVVYARVTVSDDIGGQEENSVAEGTLQTTADLCEARIPAAAELSLTNAEFDADAVCPGQPLPVTVYLKNGGFVKTDACTVTAARGGETVASAALSCPLAPGETGSVVFDLPLPADVAGPEDFVFTASLPVPEANEENNAFTATVGYPDLSLAVEKYASNGRTSAAVAARNRSAIPTDAVLTLKKDPAGEPVWTSALSLAPGEEQKLLFPPEILEANFSGGETVFLNLTSQTEERVLSDNDAYFVMDTPNVEPYTYTILADDTIRLETYQGDETALILPATYDDYPVTAIGPNLIGTRITAVTIPASVTQIDTTAFDKASALQTITVEADNPAFRGDGILYSADGKTLIRCPVAYKGDFTIPDTVTALAENAFAGTSIPSVTLGLQIAKIGKNAFRSCGALTTVRYEASAAAVTAPAFSACPALNSISVGKNVSVLPAGLGSDLKALRRMDVDADSALAEIGKNVLASCPAFRDIYYNNYLKTWKTIRIDGENAVLLGAALHCAECAGEHTWDEGVVTTAPTCTEEGVRSFTCTVCGKGKTEPEPELGHDFTSREPLDDTYHTCICSRDPSHTEKERHTFDQGTVTLEPTCTEYGERRYVCVQCGQVKTESVSKRGHAYGAWTPVDEETHERVCSRDASHVETGAHIWANGDWIRQPTCAEAGERIMRCSMCGLEKTVTVGAFSYTLDADGSATVTGYQATDTEVTVPETLDGHPVKYLSVNAFDYKSVTKLTFGKNLQLKGETGFYIETLQAFAVDPENPYYTAEDGVLYSKDKTTLLRFPQAHPGDAFTVPDCVTALAPAAFRSAAAAEITLPDTVTALPKSAFSGAKVQTVNLPASLKSIGVNAFRSCSSLRHIDLPEELEIIEDGAFRYAGLTDLTIPASVKEINELSFANCTSLTGVRYNAVNASYGGSIPSYALTTINQNTPFLGCSALTKVTVGAGVKALPPMLFCRLETLSLVEIEAESALASIGAFTFYTKYLSGFKKTIKFGGSQSSWNSINKHKNHGIANSAEIKYLICESYAHDWETVVLEAATCLHQTLYRDTCTKCKLQKSYYAGAFGPHDFGDWTAVDDTLHMRVCRHSEEHTQTDRHSLSLYRTVPPTCTADGYDILVCTECGHTITHTTYSATGHAYGEWIRQDDAQHYAVCGNDPSHVIREEHRFKVTAVLFDPTCEEDGLQELVCTGCGFTKTEPVEATGHDYGDWEQVDENCHCRICRRDASHVDYESHEFDTLEFIIPLSCENHALVHLACPICGFDDIVDIEPLGHDYGAWEPLDESLHVRICANDGTHRETAPHSLQTTHVAPTCTADGYDLFRCEDCGWTKRVPLEATGHVYGIWTKLDDDRHVAVCANDPSHKIYAPHQLTDGGVLTPPACEASGVRRLVCADCGYETVGTIPPLTHDFGDWTPRDADTHGRVCKRDPAHTETGAHTFGAEPRIVPASCETPGKRIYACTVCGFEKEERIDPSGHAYGPWTSLNNAQHQRVCINDPSHAEILPHTWDAGAVTKIPDCAHTGVRTYTCTVCGAKRNEILKIDDTNHVSTETVPGKPATCTADGVTEGVVCADCGAVLSPQTPIRAKGHSFGGYAADGNATCTADGTKTAVCSRCGQKDTVPDPGSKTAHTPKTIPAVAATCTAKGKTAGSKCSVCGAVLTAQTDVPAKGHTPETIPAVAATCTAKGKTAGSKCSVCGAVLTAQTDVPAKGHTPETIPAVAATCTAKGKTAGSRCSVCGTILTAQTDVPAKGHTPEMIPAVAATCTAKGKTAGSKCSVCGTVLTAQTDVPVNAANHGAHPTALRGEKAPTAAEEGFTGDLICTGCGAVLKPGAVIPRLSAPKIDGAAGREAEPNALLLLPGQKPADILAMAPGAALLQRDGSEADPEQPVGSGYTLVKSDGVRLRVLVMGDNDGSGTVTAADARLALRNAVGLEPFADWQTFVTLVGGNEKVMAAEARLILRGAVGLEKPAVWYANALKKTIPAFLFPAPAV